MPIAKKDSSLELGERTVYFVKQQYALQVKE